MREILVKTLGFQFLPMSLEFNSFLGLNNPKTSFLALAQRQHVYLRGDIGTEPLLLKSTFFYRLRQQNVNGRIWSSMFDVQRDRCVMPLHFSLESLLLIILQIREGAKLCNWDSRFSLAHGNLIELSVLRRVAMRFRFASKFGWWIPSEAEECFDLEPWRDLWQRLILSHPHPRTYPTPSMTCYWDGRSAAHNFALMLRCWNTVKLAFPSPKAQTSVIWLQQALDLL